MSGFWRLEYAAVCRAGAGDSQAGTQGLTEAWIIDGSRVSGIARVISRRAAGYQSINRARVRNGAGSEVSSSTGTGYTAKVKEQARSATRRSHRIRSGYRTQLKVSQQIIGG